MKVLSEKDIQGLSARAKAVIDGKGDKVHAFKYQRPDAPETKKDGKAANWLKNYLGIMVASVQLASSERQILNGLMAQILKLLSEKESKGSSDSSRPNKWDFKIIRDEKGFIKEIEAIRKG